MIDWAFIAKSVFAALLAMGLAMQLEIDQPRIAMLTVFIVMQPQSGMVLAKSLYRLLGTAVGCVASLILFAGFAQQRELLLLGLSLWVGLCTAGAARYRNHAPYGFVLAGYTACIVLLPLVEQPLQVFDVVVDRLATVSLGIFCAGLVSAVVFPRSSAALLIRSTDQLFQQFIPFLCAALEGKMDHTAIRRGHLHFTAGIMGVESLRSGASFEDPQVLAIRRRLQQLNAQFMKASTRFHALMGLMHRLQKSGKDPLVSVIRGLLADMALLLAPDGRTLTSDTQAGQGAHHAAYLKERLLLHATRLRAPLAHAETCERLRDYDTATELLFRLVGDLYDYAKIHSSIDQPEPHPAPANDRPRYIPRTDLASAITNGLRAVITTSLLGWFWIAAQWPSGGSACVFGATAVALCAISPRPQRAARHAVFAGLLVAVLGFLCDYLILPQIDGFWLLCLVLTPFMAVGPWMLLHSNWNSAGTIYNLFFCFVAGPANVMRYDPLDFINSMLGLLLGFTVAALSFLVLIPPHSGWLMRSRVRVLRRLVWHACTRPPTDFRPFFESAARDTVHHMAVSQWSTEDRQEALLDWALPVLEIGHAILELRTELLSPDFPVPLRTRYGCALQSVARLFESPTPPNQQAAMLVVDAVLAATETEENPAPLPTRHAVRHAQTYLHFIRSALAEMKALVAGSGESLGDVA